MVVDSNLVTGQNEQSTLTAVQNLILLSNARCASSGQVGILFYCNLSFLQINKNKIGGLLSCVYI